METNSFIRDQDSNTAFISIILPVFNGEKYIAEAVESILCQTYRNFEFIVIDDGSTDRTLSILKEFERLDDRINLISRENRGLIATLNQGIELARGQWLARMDSDDVATPNRLEKQLDWLEKTQADIAGSWVKFFGSWESRLWKGYQSDEAIKADMLFKCPFVHPSIMMRTELARQLKYNAQSEMAEDYDLWTRAALQGWKMTNVPEVLLYYRSHSEQVSVISTTKQIHKSEKIRKEYWDNRLSSIVTNSQIIADGFAVTSPLLSVKSGNLDLVNAMLHELISSHSNEARKAILDNTYRIFLRMAPHYPKVEQKWMGIQQLFGTGSLSNTRWKLKLAKHIPRNNRFLPYSVIKKIYFFLLRLRP